MTVEHIMTLVNKVAASQPFDIPEAKAKVRAAVEELAKDAERWNWLVNEHHEHLPICAVVWKKNGVRNSSEWANMVDDKDLVKHVDAAMKGQS